MSEQRQHFLLSYLKTLSVGPHGSPVLYQLSQPVGGWSSREQKDEQQNNSHNRLKNNAVAGYQGPGKIEILEGAGLLPAYNYSGLSDGTMSRCDL